MYLVNRISLVAFLAATMVCICSELTNADLLSHWNFDEGAGPTAFDSAGGNDGTLEGSTGQPTWTTGKIGGGLSFVSSDTQVVNVGSNNSITNLAGEKTFTFWAYRLASGGSKGFITVENGSSTDRWYIDDNNNSARLRMYRALGGSASEVFDLQNVLAYNTWQQITAVDDDSKWHIYVNGERKSPAGGTGTSFDLASLPNDCRFKIGTAKFSTSYQSFEGRMDDVGVWDHALTAAEAAALYNLSESPELGYDLGKADELFAIHRDTGGSTRIDGRYWSYATGLSTDPGDLGKVAVVGDHYHLPLDAGGTGLIGTSDLISHWTFDEGTGQTAADSVGNNDATLGATGGAGSDDPTWASGKIGSGALHFDGGDHVDGGNNNTVTNLSGPKSFTFWTVHQEPDRVDGFLGVDNNTSNNRWYIDDNYRSDDIRIYKNIDGSSAYLLTTSNDCLANDAWQQVTIVDDGNRWKAYVNGVFKGQGDAGLSFDFTDFSAPASEIAFSIGRVRFSGSFERLRGEMDDVGVWATWSYATGLTTDLGVLTLQDGKFWLKLDAGGTGVMGVPEPATVVLLALGALGLFVRRRAIACCK